jgi:prevent-host-death family protein
MAAPPGILAQSISEGCAFVDGSSSGPYDVGKGNPKVSKSATVADLEAHFSDWIQTAEAGEAVVITRNGRPIAAMVPAAEIEQLERLRAAGPEQGLAGLAGGWDGSEELVECITEFRRSRPRDTPHLD